MATEVKSLSDETRKATDQIGATLKSLHTKLEQFVAQTGAARKSIEHARSQTNTISVAVDNAPFVGPAAEVPAAPAVEASAPAPAKTVPAPAPAPAPAAPAAPAAVAPPPAATPAAKPDTAEGPISRADIERVQQSFAKVEPMSMVVARTFYERLFEINPEIRALFTGDMEAQGEQFMHMIGAAVTGLDDLEALLPIIQQLGARHRKYGVQVPHYAAVAEALLWTLEQGLSDAFTPDVREAWVNVYTLLAETMIAAPDA